MNTSDTTLPDLILAAAASLPQPFTREQLAVAAWQLDKRRTGLAGFEDAHPDANKLNANLMGKGRGLVFRGMLGKDGKKYWLTPLGRKRLAWRKAELTFMTACDFWRLEESGNPDAALAEFGDTIAAVESVLAGGDAELRAGRVVNAGEVRVLANLHSYLLDRFERHLNLLRQRKAVAS
jgi:hypothetical protein